MKYEIVQIDGKQCVLYDNEDSYLESIGGIYGTLFAPFWVYPPAMGGSYTVCRLSHVLDSNGEIIYKGPYYWELNPPSGVNDVKVTETADDSYYNLMGQPVEHPEDAPGIYIHEGKKVKF
ncbi:MAG: hypothetical protein KBT10_05550 [Bacteroidales bacterium]|nr:hypothetical protein [Candidatus Sodaliphilus aphodohippi]